MPTSSVAILLTIFDKAIRGLAWGLSKVSRVVDAGVFYQHGSPNCFFGLWRDPSVLGGASWTLRLGRTEVIVDVRGKEAA